MPSPKTTSDTKLLQIRPAAESDLAAITAIFNQSIESSTASMHLEPLALDERRQWFRSRDHRHAVLVGELSGHVVGWAALAPWESRLGYRETAEVSVYVDRLRQGLGIGSRLLTALVEQARRNAFHTLVARIADGHPASTKLHQRLGFRPIGTMREVGRKFDNYVDVDILQLMLKMSAENSEPIGYFCGEYLPPTSIKLSPSDVGVTHGVIITETMRTFTGHISLAHRHLDRLQTGLETIGLPANRLREQLAEAAERVVQHNYRLIPPGSDLRISMFVTPGRGSSGQALGQATTVVFTQPLAFAEWSDQYQTGISLITASRREVPAACVPRHIKHRNRLHYYLAEMQARQVDAAARALLLDITGNVAEGTTASVVMYAAGEGLVAPPADSVLPSVSWEFTAGLATQLGVSVTRRRIHPSELINADEVLWCAAPTCLLPVTQIDGHPIGGGKPGQLYCQLIDAWSQAMGIDIVAQAKEQVADSGRCAKSSS